MKILHTSDWHLGQTLYGKKRYDEFNAFLQWLAQTLKDELVDILIVSGDIFDGVLPPNQAQTLYYDFLRTASQGPCRHIIITAGNHDSSSFLDAPKALLRGMNVHVVGEADESISNEILLLRDADDRPEAVVCAVPFLRDSVLIKARPGDTVEEREQNLARGMRNHYLRCAEEAEKLRASCASAGASSIPIVAMGHLFAAGGTVREDDGVRDLRIGSLGQIDSSIFPETFDYVALGHLHIAQKVSGQDRIRYSGSPLPMGFGEAGQTKKVLLAEWQDGAFHQRDIAVPCFQKLEKISGDLPAIEARFEELGRQGESVWLEILYTGSTIAGDLSDRLNEKAPACAEILRVRIQKGPEASLADSCDTSFDLEDMTLYDVFERRLDDAERINGLQADQREVLRLTYAEAVRGFYQQNGRGDAPCVS